VRAAIHRLELDGAPIEVLLGGGLLRTADARLLGAVQDGLPEGAELRVADSEPIVGAALLGLDDLGAGPDAQARARNELREVAVHG
jgi:hypothetical protein